MNSDPTSIVQRGYDTWAAKPHNAKWVKRLDGTPIPNDLVVCIAEALKTSLWREPTDALEAVRSMIKPDAIILASEIQLPAFPRKNVFNALAYLTRTGELARIGYGKYQSPPSTVVPGVGK